MKTPRPIHGFLLLVALVAGLHDDAIASGRFPEAPVTLQVEAGAVLARYTREVEPPEYDFPLHLGGLVGAAVRIPVSNVLALQVGLAYEGRGARVDGSFPILNAEGNVVGSGTYAASDRLHYACLPLTLEASLHRPAFSPYVRVGTEAAFLVSGSRHSTTEALLDRWEDQVNVEDSFKTMDVSLLMAGGVRLSGSPSISLELRYLHGITDVTEGPLEHQHRAFVGVLGVRVR